VETSDAQRQPTTICFAQTAMSQGKMAAYTDKEQTMNGFYFKINSMFVGLVKALNPQLITREPRIIHGNSISISNGRNTVYYIVCETVRYGIENYNLISIYPAERLSEMGHINTLQS
jgi:hypothetical protein